MFRALSEISVIMYSDGQRCRSAWKTKYIPLNAQYCRFGKSPITGYQSHEQVGWAKLRAEFAIAKLAPRSLPLVFLTRSLSQAHHIAESVVYRVQAESFSEL